MAAEIRRQAPAVVVNTVGPFARTAPLLARGRACPHTSYLDLANDFVAANAVLGLDDARGAAGRTLVTGAGFGVLATEAPLAALLARPARRRGSSGSTAIASLALTGGRDGRGARRDDHRGHPGGREARRRRPAWCRAGVGSHAFAAHAARRHRGHDRRVAVRRPRRRRPARAARPTWSPRRPRCRPARSCAQPCPLAGPLHARPAAAAPRDATAGGRCRSPRSRGRGSTRGAARASSGPTARCGRRGCAPATPATSPRRSRRPSRAGSPGPGAAGRAHPGLRRRPRRGAGGGRRAPAPLSRVRANPPEWRLRTGVGRLSAMTDIATDDRIDAARPARHRARRRLGQLVPDDDAGREAGRVHQRPLRHPRGVGAGGRARRATRRPRGASRCRPTPSSRSPGRRTAAGSPARSRPAAACARRCGSCARTARRPGASPATTSSTPSSGRGPAAGTASS